MKTVRITPTAIGEELFVLVEQDGVFDRVGPIRDDGIEHVAVLDPPELSGGRQAPTKAMKKLSLKQERRNAELIGGRTQPGSGSSNRAKGDVRKLGEYRGESKFTFAKSYSLEKATLEKIASECGDGEKPLLFLDFKDKDTSKTKGSFVVMFEADFEEMLNAASDRRRSDKGR